MNADFLILILTGVIAAQTATADGEVNAKPTFP